MTISYRYLYLLAFLFVLLSCKNEKNEQTQQVKDSSQESILVPVPKKKLLSKEEVKQVNSVLARAMYTAELKTFVSLLVTTEQTNMLMNEVGPFTILAPSNSAFEEIDKAKMSYLLNPSNKGKLITLVKSHLIKENLDSASLVQNIKNGQGTYKIITMSGATYTASMDSTAVVLTDVKGRRAVLGKSDINGTNGVLHVLNNVLSIN